MELSWRLSETTPPMRGIHVSGDGDLAVERDNPAYAGNTRRR